MIIKHVVPILIIYSLIHKTKTNNVKYCEKGVLNEQCSSSQSHFSNKRYIFYDVNPYEGFNLRRDVYIRVAVFIKHLIDRHDNFQWNLVLPPWGKLFHWQSKDIAFQNQLPWHTFFNIESLKRYIPVLELFQFIKEYQSDNRETVIDTVYFLKNDKEMFKTGNFEPKNIVNDCLHDDVPYTKNTNGRYVGSFWNFKNITSRELKCVTFHGTTLDLTKNLQPLLHRTIMFDHMEIPLHYNYGSADYWKVRRSMRYNSELYEIAKEFRLAYLRSNDVDDKIMRPEDWRFEKEQRNAYGGPYLAVHLRRQDFLIGHKTSIPTIKYAVTQIKFLLKMLKLNVIFIATDTDNEEYSELKEGLNDYSVFRFKPKEYVKKKFKDGGIAIIDQIICSCARYFIGTHESTFSFRIQEDREILGFPANTTFNSFCSTEQKCFTDRKWEIVWS